MTIETELLITSEQREFWRKHGWLVLTHALPESIRQALAGWVDAVAVPAVERNRRLHYFEQTELGRALCRTERFIEDSPPLASLITQGTLPQIAGELLGDGAYLYKEKINYKQPGGAGFAPHQDATAYAFVHKHVTCLVTVDPMTIENGCLEFAPNAEDRLLPDDGDGCIDRTFAASLEWQPIEAPAGAAVFFTSYVPHRSGPNRSSRPRRALYLTYNAANEGDLRAAYYDERDKAIAAAQAAGTGGAARISTIGHFEGRNAV